MQSSEWQLHLSLDPRDLGDSKTRGLSSGVAQQRRLADTRLTTDDQDRATALAHALQEPVQGFTLPDPASERRQVLGGHSPVQPKRPGTKPGGPPGATARDRSHSVRVDMYADDTTCTGRVAIVTGGSRGIGRAVARKLASRGYAVVIDYARNQGAADLAVEEILAGNGTALAVRADVADKVDVERLFSETIEAFGDIDVIVHAAGQMILGPVADYDLKMFDGLVRANVRGTFVVNQQAARRLRDGGAIVNVSTGAVGLPTPTYAAYAASKAAVDTITKVLARELRERNITVNAVAPGLERSSTHADIANVVAFLVSENGHWVNGQVLRGAGEIVSPEPQTRVSTRALDWRDELPEARTWHPSTLRNGGHHEHHRREQ